MSVSQEYIVNDRSSLHRYRTELPNIIFDLGLDPFAFQLYAYYKKVAGDGGLCYQKKATISENLNVSPTSIKDRNKILSQPFEALGGKPLIVITQRVDESGNSLPTIVEIVDIWGDNFKILGTRFSGDGGGVAKRRGGGRQTTTEEEPIKEEPKKKPETPSAVSSSFFSFLNELEIGETLKIRICERFNESEARLLLKRVLAYEGRENDSHGVNTIMKRWEDWGDSESEADYMKKNESFLEQCKFVDGSEVNRHTVYIGMRGRSKYIEFICGQRSDVFTTDKKSFIKDLVEYANDRLNLKLDC